MNRRTTARLLFAAVLSLGLLAGCATTGDDTTAAAEQAIAEAKSLNAEVAALGFEWRDTSKIIKDAEKALADGDADKALALANQAIAQANDAKAQAEAENQKFLDRTAGDLDDSTAAGAGAAPTPWKRLENARPQRLENAWCARSCDDRIANGDETSKDCGGSCGPSSTRASRRSTSGRRVVRRQGPRSPPA